MSIQGQILEVTVVGCNKLRDTEFFTRQDPYVCLEYAHSKFRTLTCTDGGRNPTFQEKFQVPLIEGLREITVSVWNSNTFSRDDFIGNGRVQLQKVLSQGYDDSAWPIQTKHLKYAGEVKLIMHFRNQLQNQPSSYYSTASSAPYAPGYVTSYPPSPYPGGGSPYPSPYISPSYPSPYPPSAYPMPPTPQAYPPATYQQQPYAPQYPPPSAQPYYPPGPYPGSYPPSY